MDCTSAPTVLLLLHDTKELDSEQRKITSPRGRLVDLLGPRGKIEKPGGILFSRKSIYPVGIVCFQAEKAMGEGSNCVYGGKLW